MNHTYYRKYRPKQFKDVIGQDFIKKTLSNEIINNKLSHAYIFSGPRGTGKTSIAKIFSRAINCEKHDGDCCNECDSCKTALNTEIADIVELDAASNNGVGEIRNIIENSTFLPILLTKKVYIIDEAHMLTVQAWNSLLKTIEEPPEHAIFIFATTEPTKIIPTIVSRCERYNFNKLSDLQIQEVITNVCKKESITIDDEALKAVSLLADGSLRDSLSILSQLSSFSSMIEIDHINQMFGLVDIKKRIELIKSITSKNVTGVINLINELENNGVDFYKLTFQIMQILIDIYIFKKTKSVDNLKILNPVNINQINVSTNESLKMIDIFEKSLFDIKTNSNNRFYFEVAVLNCISLFDFADAEMPTHSSVDLNKKSEEIIKRTEQVSKQEPSSTIPKQEVVQPSQEKITISNEEKIKSVLEEKKIINSDQPPVDDSQMNNVFLDDIITDRSVKQAPTRKEFEELKQEQRQTPEIKFQADVKKVSKLQEDNNLLNFEKMFSFTELYDGSIKSRDIQKQDVTKENIEQENEHKQEEPIKQPKQEPTKQSKKEQAYASQMNSLFSNYETEIIEEEPEVRSITDVKHTPEPLVEKYEEETYESTIMDHQIEEAIEEDNNSISEKESVIISNVSPIESVFYQIASNSNQELKNEVNEIFSQIKGSIPKVPEEGYIVDAIKILVASKNGFVFLYDDDLSCRNLNIVSTEKNFIEYIMKKFKKIYKVIGVTKEDAKHFADSLRNIKEQNRKYQDVNIDDLKSQFEEPASAKDIALEIFKDDLN